MNPEHSGIQINDTPPDLHAAVDAVLERLLPGPNWHQYLISRRYADALRAAYEATPDPPVTPSLWKAARAAVTDGRQSYPPGNITVLLWLDSFEALAAALDSTPEPPVTPSLWKAAQNAADYLRKIWSEEYPDFDFPSGEVSCPCDACVVINALTTALASTPEPAEGRA